MHLWPSTGQARAVKEIRKETYQDNAQCYRELESLAKFSHQKVKAPQLHCKWLYADCDSIDIVLFTL